MDRFENYPVKKDLQKNCEDVPLNIRRNMYFQNGGTTAHNSKNKRTGWTNIFQEYGLAEVQSYSLVTTFT